MGGVNFIIKPRYNLQPGQIRPMHHRPLVLCLAELEVPKRVKVNGSCNYKAYTPATASESLLYFWLECARANHRKMILRHHPDRGGSHARAATINTAYARVKYLLGKKGIVMHR